MIRSQSFHRLTTGALVQTRYIFFFFSIQKTHPVTQVVSQDQIPGEGVRESLVKVQHLQQPIPLDRVQVAVGERPDVRRALADRRIRPETVAENVTLPQNRHHLVVLYDLEAAGHDEA